MRGLDAAKLANVRTLVIHDDCSDGLASALILRDALPGTGLRFVQYGTSAHRLLPATPGLLFCDFSPHRDRAQEFVDAGAIVLDHHASARDVVARFGDLGVFADEGREPGVAGAVLAFRHVWLPLCGDRPTVAAVERFATTAGVRDTWQVGSPAWRSGCVQHRLLMAFPREFWLRAPFGELATSWDSRFAWIGELLLAKSEHDVQQLLRRVHRFTTPTGIRVATFEGLSFSSEVAEAAGPDVDLVAAFGFTAEGGAKLMLVSLRARGNFDCAGFARRFGGGGHTHAAGFSLELAAEHAQPYSLIEGLFVNPT